LKSVLLDAITHDFRTPLTSIKASVTGLLADLEFNREQRKELLSIINEECDRINKLVSETAEIARLESGEVKLDLASHSVGELVSAAVADCKSITSSRPICLEVKHQGSRLLVDLSLAKRVLVHLITNAHLYSLPGKPIRIATQERGRFHTISVADEGAGNRRRGNRPHLRKVISREKQRYRVLGTGMGLPIAKAIIEAHGGTMCVVSREGRGSVFTFSLPTSQ
jgi:two-component system sensor histidine kinase KdpD